MLHIYKIVPQPFHLVTSQNLIRIYYDVVEFYYDVVEFYYDVVELYYDVVEVSTTL